MEPDDDSVEGLEVVMDREGIDSDDDDDDEGFTKADETSPEELSVVVLETASFFAVFSTSSSLDSASVRLPSKLGQNDPPPETEEVVDIMGALDEDAFETLMITLFESDTLEFVVADSEFDDDEGDVKMTEFSVGSSDSPGLSLTSIKVKVSSTSPWPLRVMSWSSKMMAMDDDDDWFDGILLWFFILDKLFFIMFAGDTL